MLTVSKSPGAIAYWIRRCLHNYSDTLVPGILGILADAMHNDSRLLIVEEIKGNPPSARTAAMDIIMAGVGGKERTQDEWGCITAKAGLKISSVVGGVGSSGELAVIKCVRDQPGDDAVGADARGAEPRLGVASDTERVSRPGLEQSKTEATEAEEAGRPEAGKQDPETSSSDAVGEPESTVSASSTQRDGGE